MSARATRVGVACLAFAALGSVCGSAAGQEIVAAPAFDAAELTAWPTENWITNGGNAFNQRYSPLTQQRGIYKSQDRVRGFLLAVFGRAGEGPVEGRLGNHIQWQPVIHVAPDGQSAKIRSRMMQQMNFGPRASMGASIYENQAVKEDGRWKLKVVHTFNTWTAGYEGGWVSNPGRSVPGPSQDYAPGGPPTFEFEMFPNVYAIPFHYRHPVTGLGVAQRVTGDD